MDSPPWQYAGGTGAATLPPAPAAQHMWARLRTGRVSCHARPRPVCPPLCPSPCAGAGAECKKECKKFHDILIEFELQLMRDGTNVQLTELRKELADLEKEQVPDVPRLPAYLPSLRPGLH